MEIKLSSGLLPNGVQWWLQDGEEAGVRNIQCDKVALLDQQGWGRQRLQMLEIEKLARA